MKSYKIFIAVVFFVLSFISSSYNPYACMDDPISNILKVSDATVCEVGTTFSFYTYKCDRSIVANQIFNLLQKTEQFSKKVSYNKMLYKIEFYGYKKQGYIDVIKCEDKYMVKIYLLTKEKTGDIKSLHKQIDSIVSKNQFIVENASYYDYIKGALKNNKLYMLNSKIIEILNQNNANNINTIKLENGYSTVAFTGKYKRISNNGHYIDLNYALCNYNSGSYIVIGTPVIMETY